MIQSLGLGPIGTEALWASLLCLAVLALVVGFISDNTLGGSGFGLFGNTLIGFAGACASLVAVIRFGWRWLPSDIVTMSGASVLGAFFGVLLLALLRRIVT